MRIEPKTVTPITSFKAREQAAPGKTSEAGKSAVVTLSTAGTAASHAADEPPSVIPRVHQIRAAIERGDYPIDLDKLATHIVDDEGHHRGGTA